MTVLFAAFLVAIAITLFLGMTTILLALVLGFAAGAISGIFGVGGGVLFVPTLVLVTGLTQLEAQATSLAATTRSSQRAPGDSTATATCAGALRPSSPSPRSPASPAACLSRSP